MHFPQVHYLAVLVSGIAIFVLGGLWYSPVLFAKKWTALMGKSEADLKAGSSAMPTLYLPAFLCGLLSAWALAVILNHFTDLRPHFEEGWSVFSAGWDSPVQRASRTRSSP